jgi:hypothetical protein
MMRRYVRYFAATDSTPIGHVALDYLKSLLRVAPVRVASLSGGMTGPWEHYAALMVTQMNGPFVNVVCCDPSRWTWVQSVPMPRRLVDGTLDLSESASGRQELYTQGVRNVLITGADPAGLADELRSAALRYEQIIATSTAAHQSWIAARGGAVRGPVTLVGHTDPAVLTWDSGSPNALARSAQSMRSILFP